MNRLPLIALLLAALLPVHAQEPAAPAPAAGTSFATDGKVWGALIYASKGEPLALPAEVPVNLKDLDKRLSKVFPYTRYEFIGQAQQDILRQYESWVVPSKDLFVKLDSKGPAPDGGMNLNLQFWRDQQVLVKTDLVLRKDSPLFLGGPKWRDGQVLFVLLLTGVDKN